MSLRLPVPAVLLALAACAVPAPAEEHALIARTKAFRAARESGEVEAASSYLSEDPRQWFETREGPGRPWKLDGPWKRWDETEINDFYRLIERPASPVRLTWFWNDQGLLEGFLVAAMPHERASDRLGEAQAWARQQRPDELAYLMPAGRLDPSGDRPERWKALLLEWRAAAGLPAVELAGP